MIKGINDLEFEKFKESTVTAGEKAIKVVNPDGSNVGGSVSVDTTGLATEAKQDDIITAIEGITVPAPEGGATSDNQTNGSQKTQIVDAGGEAVTVTGGKLDVNASVDTTGLATSANQTTIIGHVDGIETLLGTIDSDTSNLSTKIDTIAGAVSGTEMQVDIVSGSVTANAGTNLNTSALALETGGNLASIKTNTDKIPAQGQALAAASLPVVLPADQITTLTPPAAITGFATSAKQDTIIGHVDGIETLLGTIDADTGNIATSLGNIDNAVDGNYLNVNVNIAGTDVVSGSGTATGALRVELPTNGTGVIATVGAVTAITNALPAGDNNVGNVDIASIAAGDNNIGNVDIVTMPNVTIGSALPAGTNAIGKLSANSGVDIGDVDVTSLPAIPAGTSAIGKLLPPDIDVTAHSNYARKYYTSAGAATDGIVWSPAAGKRWHVVALHIQTSAAATITLEDDKTGGDDPVWKGEFAANGGAFEVYPEKYPLASGEDAADLLITTSAGNVYVTVVGYEV